MAAVNGFTDTSPDTAYGDANWGQTASYADAQQFTAPGSGTLELSEIGCYAHSNSAEQTIRFAVFTDDAANGCPEDIVANSEATLTFNSGTIAKRSASYTSTKPQLTGGAVYWIAAICSGVRYTRYFATGGDSVERSAVIYPTWPTASEWQGVPIVANANDLSLYAVYSNVPAVGELALGGYAPTVLIPFILAPSAGSMALDAPPRFMADLYCGTERITSQEVSPTSTFATTILNLTDAERALITDWNDLELALTAYGRRVYVSWAGVETPGIGVAPDAGSMAVTGVAPLPDLLGQDASVAGSMAFDGNAPSLHWDRVFFPALASLSLGELLPVLNRPPDAIAKLADLDAMALDGLVPVVLRDYSVFPALAAMALDGLTISPSTSHTLYPGVGALVFAGDAPLPPARSMRWSGETLTVAGVAPRSFTVAGITGGQLECIA